MRKTVLMLTILSFTAVGCTGSFNLTRKVYNFHRSQDDKWADELFFLGCVLIPIYGISTFADALVFNSIEFWTGENPVEMTQSGVKTRQVKDGSREATISYNSEDKEMTIVSKENPTVVVEKGNGMAVAKDGNGDLLYTSMVNDSGDIVVYDKDFTLVKKYSSKELNAMKEKYLK